MKNTAKLQIIFLILAMLVWPHAARADYNLPYADVCNFVAAKVGGPVAAKVSYTTYFASTYLIQYGWFDADGDGIPDKLGPEISRTGDDLPDFSAPHDTATRVDFPAEMQALLDVEYERYGNAGNTKGYFWLPYGTRLYQVEFTDEYDPVLVNYVSYYVPGQAKRYACGFQSHVSIESWGCAGESVPKIFLNDKRDTCPAGNGVSPSSMSEVKPVAALSEEASNRLALSTRALGWNGQGPSFYGPASCAGGDVCQNIWKVDFDNDGVMDRMVKLENEGGNNWRGCNHQRFLLLGENDIPVYGPKQAALDQLQTEPDRCDIGLSWVSLRGKVLLVKGPDDGTYDKTIKLFGEISMARGTQTATLLFAHLRIEPQIIYSEMRASKK